MAMLVILNCLSISANAQSRSDNYINEYGKSNADKTLKLMYISQETSTTTVYVRYMGNANIGTYTGLYLNNFRLIDRDTKKEYYPKNTYYLPTRTDGKFYLYNADDPMMLPIEFDRLPSTVRFIDLVENDGSTAATYNFTFRSLYLEPSQDVTDEMDFLWEWDDLPYCTSFYTYDEVSVELSVDGRYVDKLDRRYTDRSYKPACGEFGSVMIGFPTDRERALSAKSPDGKYTWSFNFTPVGDDPGNCNKKNLKIN
jgi:hypothetical protein